jgi:signal transduction histidine kinase
MDSTQLLQMSLGPAKAHENGRRLLDQAVQGRLAVLIAHDTAKRVWCLRALAQRVRRLLEAGARPTEDAESLLELVEEVGAGLRRIVTSESLSEQFAQGNGVSVAAAVRHAVAAVRSARATPPIEIRNLGKVGPLKIHGLALTVIENLVDNAALSGSESVRVGAHLDGCDVIVEVTDRGCGLPGAADSGDWIGETANTRAGGQGVGLRLSRQVVEYVGGSLRLRGRVGGGVAASLSLPRIPDGDCESGEMRVE